MRRLSVFFSLLALSSALTGCGGGKSAEDVLRETAAKLGELKSGDLQVELVFRAGEGQETGFMLDGPFSLEEGPLVAGELDYTQLGAEQSQTAKFISTGQKAFVEVRGQAYELPPETTAQLQAASGQLRAGGLEQIDLGQWLEDPELEDGGEVGGTETDFVRARLDVAEVVNTLLVLQSAFGGDEAPQPLTGTDTEQLENAVASSSVGVWTGKDDRLLRKLELTVEFDAQEAPDQIRELVGGSVRFLFAVGDLNEDVSVEPPADPRPYSERSGSG